MAGLARSLQTGLTCSLASNTEQWRRSLAQLDRRHSKQFRAARSSLGKKRDTLAKVEKKLKKGKEILMTGLEMTPNLKSGLGLTKGK